VMAFWGAPVHRSIDPHLTVLTALKMQSELCCLNQRRRKLGKGEWAEGRLEVADGTREPIPAAWTLDLRRFRARLVADDLGLRELYWVCRGGPVERHRTDPFTEDQSFELAELRNLSRAGLRRLRQIAARLDELPDATRSVGSDPARLRRVAVLAVGLSLLLAALLVVAAAAVDGTAPDLVHRSLRAFGVLAHPVLVPTLALGAYLRRLFAPRAPEAAAPVRRELSSEEAASAWNRSAPHLLAVWTLAALCVLLLTAGRLIAARDLGPLALVDDFSGYCLVVLWILTPLSYARDTPSAIGAGFEAGLTLVVALFVLKVTLFATHFATSIFWSAVGWAVPVAIPDWIRAPFDLLAAIGAELFFFTLFLGYTWAKAREHFGRWATVPRA